MRRAAAILVVFIVLAGGPAASYVLLWETEGEPPLWPGATAVIHHDPDSFDPEHVAALESALATWSAVPDSEFRFAHGGPSEAEDVRTIGNGSSDCYFDAKLDRFAYAVTIMNWLGTPYVLERDIAFNANPKYADRVVWTTEPSNRAGGPVDFETVLLHELGHVVGLGHSKAVSVMNTDRFPDPAFARRELFSDDEDGVRALYPPGTAAGPDVAITDLAVDETTLRVTVENRGDVSAGPFLVSAHLTDRVLPSPLDPLLSRSEMVTVPARETIVVEMDRVIPPGMPPGEYRVGVILDVSGLTKDTDRSNNAAVASETVTVIRDALAIHLGTMIDASIGPFGTDRYTFDLLAGTKVRFRQRMARGTAALVLYHGPEPVLTTKAARSVKAKFEPEQDGAYRIELLSGYSGLTSFLLRTKIKTIRGSATETLSDGWTWTVPIPAYAGGEVKIVVRGKNGLRPSASVDGVDAPVKTNGAGTKVTLGPFTVTRTRRPLLRVTGSPAGTVKASWRCRSAKDRPLVVR